MVINLPKNDVPKSYCSARGNDIVKLLKTLLTGLYGVWSILSIVLIFTGTLPVYFLAATGLFLCALSTLNGNGGLVTACMAYLTAILLSLAFPVVVYLMTSSNYNAQNQSRDVVMLLIFGTTGMLTMYSLLFSRRNSTS